MIPTEEKRKWGCLLPSNASQPFSKAFTHHPALFSFCPLELRVGGRSPSSIQPSMARLMDLAMPWSLPFINPPGKSPEDKTLALWEAILPPAQPSQSLSSLDLSHCSSSEWKGVLGFIASFQIISSQEAQTRCGTCLRSLGEAGALLRLASLSCP